MKNSVKTILGNSIGAKGVVVDVECHLSNSLPNIVIVGFAAKSIDEAKERIRGALASSEIKLPKKRITINLAPADVPKEGSSFDLAIAISIMKTAGIVKNGSEGAIVIGELGLDGSIRPVRGIIGKILAAKDLGINSFIIPFGNLEQASLIPDIEVIAVSNLKDTYNLLNSGKLVFKRTSSEKLKNYHENTKDSVLFDDISGQERAKRALVIAAAGHHNILMSGPPGTGKSMLAKALRSIMPPLSVKEKLEVTHLHSLANKNFDNIIHDRPVRSPHHTSSQVSIVGGGSSPRPGEISLSHHGILFFDELPEFNRSVLEALRQPLEDNRISVSRAKDSVDYPAHFILVATANPCPCGYYDSKKECICLPTSIVRYQKKISGPVIDRIDLYVDVEDIDHKKLLKTNHSQKKSSDYRSIVGKARDRQISKYGKLNSELTNRDIKKLSRLDKEAENMLNQAAEKLGLSARGYVRSIKVASTIADLSSKDKIGVAEISEALQYRKMPVKL
ncbi:YifB family Mg chelatase-like AAA ATPase [Candidatus Saccharibacteria bacterium]|nr:YifB family Mg chelatase-like AAA ATPase [Candidatus Saccharibacteria bacterium]